MSRFSAPLAQWQRRSGAIVLVGVVVLLVALAGRLVYIETTLRPRLTAIAERQQDGYTVIPARRGTIRDARGRVVATSRQMFDVFVDPLRVDDPLALAQELAARLDVPTDEIVKAISDRPQSRFVVVTNRVDEVTAEAVRNIGHRAVGLRDRPVRSYPLGSSMAHVLGFVGRDNCGLEGLELAYDEHLAGVDGRRATIRDARRRALWRSGDLSTPPIEGGHIVLTIDAEIQRIAEETLEATVAEFKAQSGVSVLMSPVDGRILAMACVPTFDPNNFAASQPEVRRNRAVTDPVEPGSTFKPFIACGALDGGFIDRTEQIDCRMGSHRFGRRLVTDSSPHGLMDLKGIVARSSNIGMAFVGQRMGNEQLHRTIRRFGFGSITGAGFPGEDGGVVRPLGDWDGYSTVSVTFGYEILVTPLQLITAFAALANDGILLQPRLVDRLLSPSGDLLDSFSGPAIVDRATSSEAAHYMAGNVLRSVVENGSGRVAKVAGYTVFGKTGTAKLLSADVGQYEPGSYLSTFLGVAPASDPQIAVLVMVRRPDPGIGYYGAKVSAPAVGKILEKTLAYLDIPPDADSQWAGL